MIWRPVITAPTCYTTSLRTVLDVWTLDELVDTHRVLDHIEAVEEAQRQDAEREARQKNRRQ